MSSLVQPTRPAGPEPGTHARAHDHAPDHTCTGCLSRRDVLVRAGVASVGVAAVGVLAACGVTGPTGPVATPGDDGSLARLDDIPVGGAVSATGPDGNPILLTQPQAGTVVGLSAICTHQGCTVLPDDGQLHCPCHGSVFGLDGSNVSGPAPTPLPTVEVHVRDGAVFAGQA